MKKVAIVILNYMNYEDTIDCINCGLNQSYPNIRIIVVENGSPNPSYDILKFIYAGNKRVKILRSMKNLGFAKGNNIGIRYARNHCKADYVFVCNNDVVFETTLIEEMMNREYEDVGAFSPTIYQLDGKLQPITVKADDMYSFIRHTMLHMGVEWIRQLPLVNDINQIGKKIANKKNKRRERINTELGDYHNDVISKRAEDTAEDCMNNEKHKEQEGYRYQLQGCAFVLTPSFFQYYQQLYPKTFLYWEEINLLLYLQKVGLRAILLHTSPCIHKGMGASNHLIKSRKKARKRLWYSTKSLVRSLPMHYATYKQIAKKYQA